MGTIAQELTRIQTAKADIKTAIEAKGVVVPSSTTIDGYAALVGQISGGQTEAEANDVNFYDYDGTRLFSYTNAEALALTALPTYSVQHSIANGATTLQFLMWNYTLAEMKATVQACGGCDVGAIVKPSNGKTYMKVVIDDEFFLTIGTYLAYDGVVVNYGDGSGDVTITKNAVHTHTYPAVGTYWVTASSESDFSPFTNSSYKYGIITSPNITTSTGRVYNRLIKEFYQGNHVIVGSYTAMIYADADVATIFSANDSNAYFTNLYVKAINIPPTTYSTASAIQACANLERISISPSFKLTYFTSSNSRRLIIPSTSSLTASVFTIYNLEELLLGSGATSSNIRVGGCANLRKIKLPATLTEITTQLLSSNVSRLAYLKIPSGVATIAAQAFGTRGIVTYDFSDHTSVPTLENTNAFLVTDATRILVPSSLYNTWITTTNWVTFADYIVAV